MGQYYSLRAYVETIKNKKKNPIALFGNEPFSSHLRINNINEYKYDWTKKLIASNFASAKYQPMKHIEDNDIW